jgi:hypothetical protein
MLAAISGLRMTFPPLANRDFERPDLKGLLRRMRSSDDPARVIVLDAQGVEKDAIVALAEGESCEKRRLAIWNDDRSTQPDVASVGQGACAPAYCLFYP